MTNEAIEAAARAMGRVISFDGDPISHYATADELTAMARAAAPALMEEGARLALEAAREEWTDSWTIFDCRIRALDPAAIVKEHRSADDETY